MKVLVLQALFALAIVNAQQYKGSTKPESFYRMSPAEGNDWTDASKVGAILGFLVFGTAYLTVVLSIFNDIKKSGNNYDQMIAEDKMKMAELGLQAKFPEFEKELAIRLSGVK